MKNIIFLLLLSSLSLCAQHVETITHPGAEPYRQPAEELAMLERMANETEAVWKDAIAGDLRPVQVDTLLAKFIVYAAPDGLVRYAEDVWVVRVRNQWEKRARPLDMACRRVLMAEYYADR